MIEVRNLKNVPSIVLFQCLVFLSACSGDDNNPGYSQQGYVYQVPQGDADWDTSGLGEHGLDPAAFETMMNRQDLEAMNIHSILIVKDNALVFEAYFDGSDSAGMEMSFDQDTMHEQFSVTKSISSLLTGIAIEEGYISNVSAPLSSFLPDYSTYFSDPLKQSMTLFDVLTMQSGLDWQDFGVSVETSLFRQAEDPVEYTLALPSIAEPGSTFTYSTGVATFLSEVIANATGVSIEDFAQEYLFTPLNINQASWQRHESGHIYSGTGLRLRPRDMAKIGWMVLDGGLWKDSRIVPEQWIDESWLPHVVFQSEYPSNEYGYYWWMREFALDEDSTTRAIYAAGFGGQLIYVLPELDAVVVFTGGNFNAQGGQVPSSLMSEDIVPNLVPR